MAMTHVLFHLPAGVSGIFFYQALASPEPLGANVVPLWTLYLLSMSVSVFESLADFIIYLYAFPVFRSSARHLLSRLFLSGSKKRPSRVRAKSLEKMAAGDDATKKHSLAVMAQKSNGGLLSTTTFESTFIFWEEISKCVGRPLQL